MISLEAQLYIFYGIIILLIIVILVWSYQRSKQLEKERLEGFEPSIIKAGDYHITNLKDQPLDPYAFNVIVVDTLRLSDSCQLKNPVDKWYISVIADGPKSSEIALIKPDMSESLAVNINNILRTEKVEDGELGSRSVWIISRVGRGWSLIHKKTGLYLTWNNCTVGLKSQPDATCVFKLTKYKNGSDYDVE